MDQVRPGARTRQQVELRLLVAALVVLGLDAVLLSGPLRHLGVFDRHDAIPALVLFAPLLLTEFFLIQMRFGGRVTDFALGALPVAAGFYLVEPRATVLMYVLAVAIAQTWQRVRPAIFLANVAIYATGAAVGILLFRAVAPRGAPLGLASWGALILGQAGFTIVAFVMTFMISSIRSEDRLDGTVRTGLVIFTADALNATLGFLGLRLMLTDWRLAVPLALVAIFVAVAYRSYTKLLGSNESLERLYESTREIERPRGHRASIQALLDQTLDLLSGDTAELTLLGTDEHQALVLVSGRDRFFEELPSDIAERIATERMAELLDGDAEVTPEADETFAGFDEQTATQMKRQVITAPLQSPGGLVGSLRVSMNYGVTFSEADRHLLEMFANHASVALHNSRLIDQLRAEIAEREHQALHDDLTSLPNRVMFDLQTRQALDHRGPNELIAVILVDLDRFKEVNDTLGHDRGDELLERLGSRIAEVGVARNLTVARLGGDEFAVLLRAATDEADVRAVASSVRVALETPIEVAGVLVDVRASLGVAIAPTDGEDATTLLQRADVAMYIAKSRHHGVVFYEPETDPYSPERLSLAADLRHAVAKGDVQPHFQPVTSLVTGEPISVEALARWTHPSFGVVPPDVFIPIAEQSGLIRELTYHMLDRSLEQIRRWKAAGFELHVAVNLSVRLLLDDDLVDNIARHLELAGVEPEMLTLEVTEGTIMADPERAISILEELHALGVSLSIDDFGMGYSSLNLLKRMPVSQLKIDRSFVTALPNDRDDAVIVESVVHLGHNLGMSVVAEGVEDLAALEHLRSIGCDSVQGFYLSPALPPAELLRWLRRRPQFSPAAIALR